MQSLISLEIRPRRAKFTRFIKSSTKIFSPILLLTCTTPLILSFSQGALAQQACASNFNTLQTKPAIIFVENHGFVEQAIKLIQSAKTTIYLDFYLFGGPRAQAIFDELLLAKKRGVNIKIILDPGLGKTFGTIHTKYTVPMSKALKENFDLVFSSAKPFGSSRNGKRLTTNAIDHNKYIIADESTAIVGSINLSPAVDKFYDLAYVVGGQAAKRLSQIFLFDHDMQKFGTSEVELSEQCAHFDLRVDAPQNSSNSSTDQVFSVGPCREEILKRIIELIDSAESEITIMVQEIGVVPEVMTALQRSISRGVKVKALMTFNSSINVGFLTPALDQVRGRQMLHAQFIEQIVAMGGEAKMFETASDRTTNHAKGLMIDREILFAGSANWTEGGFRWVKETNIESRNPALVGAYGESFEREFAKAKPVHLPNVICKLANKLLGYICRPR